jgi:hypothetical protein
VISRSSTMSAVRAGVFWAFSRTMSPNSMCDSPMYAAAVRT